MHLWFQLSTIESIIKLIILWNTSVVEKSSVHPAQWITREIKPEIFRSSPRFEEPFSRIERLAMEDATLQIVSCPTDVYWSHLHRSVKHMIIEKSCVFSIHPNHAIFNSKLRDFTPNSEGLGGSKKHTISRQSYASQIYKHVINRDLWGNWQFVEWYPP